MYKIQHTGKEVKMYTFNWIPLETIGEKKKNFTPIHKNSLTASYFNERLLS